MKLFHLLFWVVIVSVAVGLVQAVDEDELSKLRDEFEAFKVRYNKSYHSWEEHVSRLLQYIKNRRFVDRHNADETQTWKAGINEFSDWSYEEFRQRRLMSKPQQCSATLRKRRIIQRFALSDDIPDQVDWRKKGIISPVENQGNCGSCWTFSTTGALEAHLALYGGSHVQLSQQNLIDCAQRFNNNGCDGGLPSQAFEYVHYNGGLDLLQAYPYQGVDSKCHFDSSSVGVRVKQVVNITANDEQGLTRAIATAGPVSIAYDCSDKFMHYSSGVFSDPHCGTSPSTVNHAVLFVGYGTTPEGVQYFIAKNSWGSSWGEDGGYFRILRGSNECGLSDCASYPILEI